MENDLGASNSRVHALIAPKVPLDHLDVTVKPQIRAISAGEVVEYSDRIAPVQKPSYDI
jgi:hypothetical protein